MLTFIMKTISMVDLRTQSERIVRELQRGERMILSYRGKPLAELVPSVLGTKRPSPLEALERAHQLTAQEPGYQETANHYLENLRADQKTWGERSSS